MNRHVFIAMMAISWFGLGFITADRWFGKYTIQASSPVYVFDRDPMLGGYSNGIWVDIECGSVRNPCPTPIQIMTCGDSTVKGNKWEKNTK